jgi:hypothetical protein
MNHTFSLVMEGAPNESSMWIVVGIVVAIAVLLIIILLGLYCKQLRRAHQQEQKLQALQEQFMNVNAKIDDLDPKLPINKQADQLPYNPKYELARERLTTNEVVLFQRLVHLPVVQVIGHGQFGRVYRGQLMRGARVSDVAATELLEVAVKKPLAGRSIQHQKALLDELKVMIAIGTHCNVLALVGAVTKHIARSFFFA